jgi:hypothetical protein
MGRVGVCSVLCIVVGLALSACSDQSLHEQEQPKYAAIQLDPPSIDFGSLEVGQQLMAEVTITSTGEADLEVTELNIEGPEDNFEIFEAPELPLLMPPESMESLTLRYTSTGAHDKVGSLHVFNTDPDNGDATVELHGAGLAPAIQLDPGVYDFGAFDVSCDVTTEILVRSVGTYPLTISDFAWYSSPSPDAMTYFTDTLFQGLVMDPGDEVTVEVTFQPDDVIDFEGLLTVSSDDPDTPVAEANQYGLGEAGAWYNDHFVQEGNNWTDVLWVVDNSCSMGDEQGKLGDDFSYFHSIINGAGVDYKIATVTTDNDTFLCSGCNHGYIDPLTPNGAAQFAQNCAVGTNGSGSEQGLRYGWDALQRALAESPPNDHFLREDAGLRLVFVSDEPDQSGSWATYLSNFQGLKFNPDHVVASSICGTDGSNATSCSGQGGSADPGTGYVDVVNSTGGILASICDSDWSAALTNLGWLTVSLADTFPLTNTPVIESTIEVKVNSVDVYNGWSFDSAIQSVVFEPDYVPDDGDYVDVSYGVPGSCGG